MSQSTQILPLGYGSALTTAAANVVVPNPTRGALWLINPHATITVYVAPLGVITSPGGAGWVPILAGAMLQFQGPTRATCGWQAAMASTTGNVSVLEWPA